MSLWIVFCGDHYDHTTGGARNAVDTADNQEKAKELSEKYLAHSDWVQVMCANTLEAQYKDHGRDWEPEQ